MGVVGGRDIGEPVAQPMIAIGLLVWRFGIGHPVGVEQQVIARVEVDRQVLVSHVGQNGQGQIVFAGEHFHGAYASAQQGRWVARAGENEAAIAWVKNAVANRDEKIHRIAFAEQVIGLGQDPAGRSPLDGEVQHQGARHGHEKRCSQPFARDISHQCAAASVGQFEPIKEVAPELTSGEHAGVCPPRHLIGEALGKNGQLHRAAQKQLLVHSFSGCTKLLVFLSQLVLSGFVLLLDDVH